MLQHNSDLLRLTLIEPAHIPLLYRFTLPPHQERYTTLPYKALEARGAAGGRLPVVLLHHDKPVAFLILDRGDDLARYTPNPHAVLVRSLSVDFKSQGQGFGQSAMRLLPDFAREHLPGVNEIALAVNARNEHARHVYRQSGYHDRGYRVMGRQGIQHILHIDLPMD